MKNSYKLLFFALFASLFTFVGCSDDEYEPYPEPEVSKTGYVELVAAIENASTKASLVPSNGEARWLENDAISVVCTDGTVVPFDLNGTGDTRKAFFCGIIPDGNRLGSYAYYPISASCSNGVLTYEYPTHITPTTTGTCAAMVAEIPDDDFNIEFKQLSAYLVLTLNNIPSEADTIEITSDRKIGGKISFNLETAVEEAEDAEAEDYSVYIDFTRGTANLTAFFGLPAGDYLSLTVNVYSLNGILLATNEFLTYSNFARGEFKTVTVAL